MATIYAKEVKIGDLVIRAGGIKFNTPEHVTDVFVSPINDRVYMDFAPHAGSINGGLDFYVRGYHAQIEIA